MLVDIVPEQNRQHARLMGIVASVATAKQAGSFTASLAQQLAANARAIAAEIWAYAAQIGGGPGSQLSTRAKNGATEISNLANQIAADIDREPINSPTPFTADPPGAGAGGCCGSSPPRDGAPGASSSPGGSSGGGGFSSSPAAAAASMSAADIPWALIALGVAVLFVLTRGK